jgi:endonuclease/exonuclease/phosphatase (EEP) superfamily protein YafD
LKIGFWNIGKRNLGNLVARFSLEQDLDVLCLAENELSDHSLITELNNVTKSKFSIPDSDTPKLTIATNDTGFDLYEVYGDVSGRLTVRRFLLGGEELLLVAVHLASKRDWSSEEQSFEAVQLANQIRDEEERRGHRRTILCGDLNMNPFESGVISAVGLHAMATTSIVEKMSRTVQGREYPYFYNPMWSFIGDRTNGPPGTHYYRKSSQISFDWNMFDQVMFRPEALPWFNNHVEIVTTVNGNSLAKPNGRPDNVTGSDHFPIVFTLNKLPSS